MPQDMCINILLSLLLKIAELSTKVATFCLMISKFDETQYLRRQLCLKIYANINCVILYNVSIDQLFNKHTLCNRTHFVFMTHFVYNISFLPYYKESN